MGMLETVNGKFVDPENPKNEDLIIEDIAWALSRTSRFAGHTVTAIPYNNAQHSIFVADMILKTNSTEIALAGLLHDAAEAYVGDIPSPIKRIGGLQKEYARIENNLLNAIYKKFLGKIVTDDIWSIVKYYDHRACQIEAYTFMRSRGLTKEWGERQDIGLVELQSFPHPDTALVSYQKFIDKFTELTSDMG